MPTDAPRAIDVRVPCPVCGAPIHPVAGRCKQCRADVRAFRAARPAAVGVLPALSGDARVVAQLAPPTAPVSPFAAPLAAPWAPPAAAAHGSPSVLPARPTLSTHAAVEDPDGRSAWRHWPIVVIVLAVVAICGAVGVMVWPPGKAAAGTRSRGTLPPAPADPMSTDPLAPLPTPSAPKSAAPPPTAPPAPPAPATADPWSDPH